MSSKFFICTIFLYQYISICYGYSDALIAAGGDANVTGLTPNVSISRTISLYDTDINITLSVYQRPINGNLTQTFRVINGSTNINSADKCISFSASFKFWGQYPIIDKQANGNGGCDAILGRQCSQGIRNALQQSLGYINYLACGENSLTLFDNPPEGCPSNNLPMSEITSRTLFEKGSFTKNGSVANSSNTWMYEQYDALTAGNYSELMKYFVFTYIVGQSYSSNNSDIAIACFTNYDIASGSDIPKTTTPSSSTVTPPRGTAAQPNGTVTPPSGTAAQSNDTATPPRGTAAQPNGTVTPPSGTATQPNSTAAQPNGTATLPSGTATQPNGTAAQRTTTEGQSNGAEPQRTTTGAQSNGATTQPSGVATQLLLSKTILIFLNLFVILFNIVP